MGKAELWEILERRWKDLRKYPNVRSLGIGRKWVNGKETDQEAIVVYVRRKVSKELLAASDVIPPTIEGAPTDVVELSTGDFELGDTEVSRRPPSTQRKMAGGVRR